MTDQDGSRDQLEYRIRELSEALEIRSRELEEALEYQTATSQVLQVISSFPGVLEPVFQAMLAHAMRICGASYGILFEYTEGAFRALSSLGVPPVFDEYCRQKRVWGPHTGLGQIVRTKLPVHILDVRAQRAFTERDPSRIAAVEMSDMRTIVVVPMLKEDGLIGAFSIYRTEVRAFTDKQIELASTFANQAVIAIENARLFEEVQARTRALSRSVAELEALGEVGRAVSSSLELEKVLTAILDHACQLSDTNGGAIYTYDNNVGQFQLAADHGTSPEFAAALSAYPIRLGETLAGACAARREAMQIEDLTKVPRHPYGPA